MRRHTQSDPAKQIPLAFNWNPNPENESILRTAYRRLELSRHYSFEQAMADRIYAIGVRNLADAIARRTACANSSKSSTSAIAKNLAPAKELDPSRNLDSSRARDSEDTDPVSSLRPETNPCGTEDTENTEEGEH